MGNEQKTVIKKILPIHPEKWVNLSTFWKILALGGGHTVVSLLILIRDRNIYIYIYSYL